MDGWARAWRRRAGAVKRGLLGTPASPPPPIRPGSVYLGDHRALTSTIYGRKLFVDTRDYTLAPHLLMDGYWEIWTTNVIRSLLAPGMRVIEAGANVGWYSVIIADAIGPTGSLDAFEANPPVYELLRLNLEINGMGGFSRAHHLAVMDRSGSVTLHVAEKHNAWSSIHAGLEEESKRYGDSVRRVEVPCVKLDDMFADDPRPLDLLKMDIEGGEALALEGMRNLIARSPRLRMIIEFGPGWLRNMGRDPGAFLKAFCEEGFALRIIGTDSRHRAISIAEAEEIELADLLLTRVPEDSAA